MTIDRKALGGALAALLLVAACGGSATPSPSAAAVATEAPATEAPATETPTEAPTQAPAATEAPQSSFEASFAPGAAGDLEALLPTEVNGVKFTRTSFTGASIPPGVPIGDTQMEQLLKDSGKSLSDIRVAEATATDSTTAGNIILAIQIKGIDSGKLEAWALSSVGDSSAVKKTVGGKSVYANEQEGFGGTYLYVKNDVVFYVVAYGQGTTMADGILAALP